MRWRRAAAASFLVGAVGCAAAPPIILQAEDATLTATSRATTRPGYEGEGYVTGFTGRRGEIAFAFDAAQAGVYDLAIRYAAPAGGKGYSLSVNDVGHDGFLPASPESFNTFEAGKVELAKGANRLVLGRGWGHYDVDSLRLTPAEPYPLPKPVAATLVDRNATPATRAIMARLVGEYGRRTLSGVIKRGDDRYVRETTGATPAMMGGDLIEYSPSRREHGSNPANETERLIEAARAGQIVTLCWHWNAPTDLIDQRRHVNAKGATVDASWYRGFYSEATTFDFAAALDRPDSPNYALLLRDIDVIAVELKKLQAAGIPVLWRPLHESDGGWFWWGTRGPEQLQKLWRLVFDRLSVHHKLDNLIWVYTWNDPAWYPGDDVVDIVAIDAYPGKINDPLAGKWADALRHFDGRKLIALSEFGGTPDVPRMQRLGVRWSYFTSWTGEHGPQKNAKEDLVRIYASPGTGNLDALPARE